MKITYFGHSALELDISGTRVLVDPFITGNKHADGVVTAAELEPDVILVTHAHGDHWGDTEAIARRSGALVVANHEIVTHLSERLGYDNVFGMNTGGSWEFNWGRVTQTYARHSSSFPDGTYGGNPNGYLIRSGESVIYMLGDTDRFVEMEWIGRKHDIDIAFMPIGDCFTMGLEESVEAARMLRPALTVPVHYGTFPPIEVDVDRWESVMMDSGFRVRTMTPGETISL